jgi:hypothetical protein
MRVMQLLRSFVSLLMLFALFGCASPKGGDLPEIVYSTWTASMQSDLLHAQMLHAGKTNELAQMLDEAIVGDAHFLGDTDTRWPKNREHWRLQMLWAIERYYDRTGKPVPPDLAKIFESIPPRPPTSCEIEQQTQKKP